MKITDLRIGNYIQDIHEPDLILYTEVDGYLLTELINELEPIKLTEEWLLRLGFKPLYKDFQKNGVIIHTRKRGFVLMKSVPIIKHVHQLQNLYFALTGNELVLVEN